MRLRPTVLILLLVVTALLGGGLGFYFGIASGARDYARLFATFLDAPYVDAALHADRDVGYLNLLGAGDTTGAVAALERDLDGNLEALADYHRLIPPGARRKAVYELVARIRVYRDAHPSSLSPGPKRDAVERALQLAPEAGPRS